MEVVEPAHLPPQEKAVMHVPQTQGLNQPPHQVLASAVLMVKPVDFGYNIETARDNEFMHEGSDDAVKVRDQALQEFDQCVQRLREHGVIVIVFDKSQHRVLSSILMPDQVFPNNIFCTDTLGNVTLFPMYAQNRNAEKLAFVYILDQISKVFKVNNISNFEYEDQVLESTGALIVDRVKNRVYCSKSQRAQEGIFARFCENTGLEGVLFEAVSETGKPIYHTNVMLAIGREFAIICTESIKGDKAEKDRVMKKLSEDREIIDISYRQLERFCANALQVKAKDDGNNTGKQVIIMSETASRAFTEEQIVTLKKYGDIVSFPISTIEQIGGGSARCMVGEIFLPYR